VLTPPKTLKHLTLVTLLCLAALSLAAKATAAPWVETGDLRARHHIEALSALGCFEGLTLTWPVNWSAVARGLNGPRTTPPGCVPGWTAPRTRAAPPR
jgi:hypothetical protein